MVALADQEIAGFLLTKPAFVYGDDTVTLSRDSQSITMQEATQVVDKPLEGTKWKVVGTFEGDATASLKTEPATIVFEGGTGTVFAGCNTGTVAYTLSGTTITFSSLALTKKACDDAAMKLETTVSRVLDGQKTFDIYGPKLTITDQPGVVGTNTIACLPPLTAFIAARIATSVFPNPTSPQTRRSIG